AVAGTFCRSFGSFAAFFVIPLSFVIRISSFAWVSIHSCPFVAKRSWRFKFNEVRQRFRLTPTEKRVAVFVLAAFVLGLGTKCYRDTHPQQAVLINKDHAPVKKAQP